MIIQSVFDSHQAIPSKYTCDGENVSPPLSFSAVPSEAQSLVLIVDDPDAPHGTFDHWIVWNLPPELEKLTEGAQEIKNLLAKQGLNHFKRAFYQGPCPPRGEKHRYYFKLYALKNLLSLPEGSTKQEVEKAMQGHVVEQAELVGTYQH